MSRHPLPSVRAVDVIRGQGGARHSLPVPDIVMSRLLGDEGGWRRGTRYGHGETRDAPERPDRADAAIRGRGRAGSTRWTRSTGAGRDVASRGAGLGRSPWGWGAADARWSAGGAESKGAPEGVDRHRHPRRRTGSRPWASPPGWGRRARAACGPPWLLVSRPPLHARGSSAGSDRARRSSAVRPRAGQSPRRPGRA